MNTTNQAKAQTVGFLPGERNVFFHLLTACNLSCQHCYINSKQHGTETLSLENVKEWLKLFSRPEKQSNLILLGGEPTLHPDLAEIIKFSKSLNYIVTVDSNGFLFHDILNKTTPEELDYLSFSLDGPDAIVNDAIRGKGVFDVCTSNVKKAVHAGFSTSLIYTVSNLNIDHLVHMPELLRELGVKRFFIQVIGLRGKSAKDKQSSEKQLQVDPQRWLDIVPAVAAKAGELGIHVTYPKVFLDVDEKFQCAGLVAENYFIFPNGRVYRCPLCEDYPINSLAIKNNTLVSNPGMNEDRFFSLNIPEGCVMNKLLQSGNMDYHEGGGPCYRISCCLLKNEILTV